MEQPKKRLTVGAGGIDPRDVRLIEIVFRHSQYNPVQFDLQTKLELKSAEILLINPMTQEGLKALAKLRTSGLNIPVISVVPRGATPGSKYAIALDRLTLQLLPILNKVVEEHYGQEEAGHQGHEVSKANFANQHLRVARSEASEPSASPPTPIVLGAPRQPESPQASPSYSVESYSSTNSNVSASVADIRAGQVTPIAPVVEVILAEEESPLIRVLVVDDSPTVRSQLSAAIQRMGLVVEVAASAMEALKHCEKQHFDLALVDVVMPEMDGYKLTREIRRHFRSTPVIILTSKSSPFDLARGALAGCDSYLVKPVSMQKLKDAMHKGLRKSLAIDDIDAHLALQLRRLQAVQVAQARVNAANGRSGLNSSGTHTGGASGAGPSGSSNGQAPNNVRPLPTRDFVKTA